MVGVGNTGTKSMPKERTARMASPSVGMDGVNQVVRALYTFKRAATYKELAMPAGLSQVHVSRSLSSARQIGLTGLAGRRGLYELTEAGSKYALYLTAGREKKCREQLRQTILENPWWSEIVNFLKVNEGEERDVLDLVIDIEAKSGKKWSNRMRGTVGGALTSILSSAGLVEPKGNKITPTVGLGEAEAREEKEEEIPARPVVREIAAPEGFAEFRIPDSFILHVRKDKYAIDFFQRQVRDNSIFVPWLNLVKKRLEEAS